LSDPIGNSLAGASPASSPPGPEAAAELPPALLALEDGSVWPGRGFGAAGDLAGELVFNTAITGYQEVLSDPSYRGQIVLMTAPEIGNVGTNPEDLESARPYCAGFVVRELSPRVSNWRARDTLASLMAAHGVAGISGIDTRAVTRRIRIGGAQRALITRAVKDPEAAVAKARRHPSMEGRDLVLEVTSGQPYEWNEGLWRPPGDTSTPAPARHRVVAYDFGIKRGILRRLRGNGCQVTVVPARTPAAEVLGMKPDGVFLSNGPGDPAAVDYAVDAVAEIVRSGTPTFGICLGHQILGLALGGRTYKLKFGHHGANHPVMDLTTRKVEITSQNHGFAVDVGSLEGKAVLTHVNLNDNTVEGMRHDRLPVFSVQYHPEASPGPNDASYLFQRFVKLMDERSRT
jgi:carbamoyl-phosphate synthase small subunit